MPDSTRESRTQHSDSFEALYEHAMCGYVDTDAHGMILRTNQTFLRWTGYAVDDLPGRLFRDLLTAGGKIFHDTHLAPLVAMQDRVDEIALDIVARVPPDVPVLASIVRYRDSAASAGLHRIILFRAADRRAYERELLAARRQAEEAANARAALLMVLSHDVRIPLHVMLGVADLLQQSVTTPEQQECVEILRSSMDNLLALVEQVLAFNRVQSGPVKSEPFDLQRLVADVVSSFSGPAAQKRLALQQSVDHGLSDVLGDPMVVRHVLTNLVANAMKSTDRGGIAVRVQSREETRDDIWVEFEVVDSGAGITPERLAALTCNGSDSTGGGPLRSAGSGLGLEICRWLLGLYGTRLRVASIEGEGSSFAFTLRFGRCEGQR